MYPSQYERFALYPPEIFEKFMQASFDSYGHEKSSVLDGGLHQWVKKGLEISTEDVQLPTGNWKAKDHVAANNITFEELQKKEDGKEYMERTDEVNFLDARIRGVSGSNIPGYKNVPAAELVNENGVMKSPEEIRQVLLQNGYKAGQPIVTNCNTGMQAAMLAFGIKMAYPDESPRVYNVSPIACVDSPGFRYLGGQAKSSCSDETQYFQA
ncbi:hypothetical protein COOONC_09299 [Cooperia oncophora]